jgi:hypothetical protein
VETKTGPNPGKTKYLKVDTILQGVQKNKFN